MRVYTVPPAQQRVWDYGAWTRSLSPPRVCLLYLVQFTLAPGDSFTAGEFLRSVGVRAVLGDSLPAGRYRVTAAVGVSGHSSGEIPAGTIDLRPPPA